MYPQSVFSKTIRVHDTLIGQSITTAVTNKLFLPQFEFLCRVLMAESLSGTIAYCTRFHPFMVGNGGTYR